jgi:hypothetical protein
LGNLIAEDFIPAPLETREQLKGLKLGAKVLAARFGEMAVNFDIDEYLNSVFSPFFFNVPRMIILHVVD